MKISKPVFNQVLQISHFFQASQREVFQAWTDPQAILAWWGDLTDAVFDLQLEGKVRLTWKRPDAPKEDITEGLLKEVYAPDRLVYTWGSGAGPESLITVDFIGKRKGSQLLILHEFLPSPEVLEAARQGWIQAFKSLELFLRNPKPLP
jgi:uncharacterized protein YndB with AHSA1/START domain